MRRQTAPTPTSRSLVARIGILALLTVLCAPPPASAHSIDYLASSISPAAMFEGNSGNFTISAPVSGGSSIEFDLTFSINTQGSTTTYPRTITFGLQNNPQNVQVALSQSVFTFTAESGPGSSFTTHVTATAPTTPGVYSFKVAAIDGTGGGGGLSGGGGVSVSFTVSGECEAAATTLAVDGGCILYHQAATTLSATLTSGGTPLSGREVTFSVDGTEVGSSLTDGNGVASLSYDPSGLAAGDHTVSAVFAGEDCAFEASGGSATLGVSYVFVGFQQPINADGSSQFGGRVIPVKIRVVDANGVSVPDASAHVFFAFGTPALVGTDAEPVGNTSPDGGNTMRYDSRDEQYIFNWDVGSLQNGTYTVRVDLGEGSCGDSHTVVVSLKRKGK